MKKANTLDLSVVDDPVDNSEIPKYKNFYPSPLHLLNQHDLWMTPKPVKHKLAYKRLCML